MTLTVRCLGGPREGGWPGPGYHRLVRFLPNILLLLALPAGLLGHALGSQVIAALPLSGPVQGILALFVPLFIAGLFMLPFVAPYFDRKARQDLAAHRREQDAVGKVSGKPRKRR